MSTEMFLVYADEAGAKHYQPFSDFPESGGLVDPDTDGDMECVGWSTERGGEVSTGDAWLVYEDSEGDAHFQPWDEAVQSGTPQDPDTDDDMKFMRGTVNADERFGNGNDTYDEDADAEAYAQSHSGDGVDSDDEDYVSGYTVRCGDCQCDDCPRCQCDIRECSECGCYIGDDEDDDRYVYPMGTSETAAVMPYGNGKIGEFPLPDADGIFAEAKPPWQLIKIGYQGGQPNTVQSFNWLNKAWSRSMSVRAGHGRETLNSLEMLPPTDRRVPEHVAAAYGHATGSCLMCGRGLTDEASMSRGYGPGCASKLG